MARCAVPARVQRAERMLSNMRIAMAIAPLNAARTAQCAPSLPRWCKFRETNPYVWCPYLG
jgi:hypothetical protein